MENLVEGEMKGFFKKIVLYNLSSIDLTNERFIRDVYEAACKQQEEYKVEAAEVELYTIKKNGKEVECA